MDSTYNWQRLRNVYAFARPQSIDVEAIQEANEEVPEAPEVADQVDLSSHQGLNFLRALQEHRAFPARPVPAPLPLTQVRVTRLLGDSVLSEPIKPTVVTPPSGPFTNDSDWHLPGLDEVFTLAEKYPEKKLILDTKTSGDRKVAARLAQQLVEILKVHPEMRDRIIVTNGIFDVANGIVNGGKDLLDGKIFKGLGEIVDGVAKGAWEVVKGVGKTVGDVVSGVGKGIAKVGKAFGNFFKSLF